MQDLYRKEGGALPEPVLNVSWSYTNPVNPDLGEVLKEINGKALADIPDPKDKTKTLKTAGQQLDGFGQLQDDGSTSCGNWLHSGVFTEAGNKTQRRNNADPTGLGMFHDWAFSWPANRRVMYNRASADKDGKPWDADRVGHRLERREVGRRRPRHQARLASRASSAHSSCMPEGVGRLFTPRSTTARSPSTTRPIEAPVDNLLHPKVSSSPVAKKFSSDKDVYGKRKSSRSSARRTA